MQEEEEVPVAVLDWVLLPEQVPPQDSVVVFERVRVWVKEVPQSSVAVDGDQEP